VPGRLNPHRHPLGRGEAHGGDDVGGVGHSDHHVGSMRDGEIEPGNFFREPGLFRGEYRADDDVAEWFE
jgi:hypothetical protein